MAHYRALAPNTEKQKSPRRAAQEGVRPRIERLTGEGVAALPPGLGPRRSKVEQLERMIEAGRVGDPLAGIESESKNDPHPAAQGRGHPPPFRGREEEAGGEGVQAPCAAAGISLLERVRQLYEESVVPVHEIARLIGVSERTLYKYVARHGWRRRHLCLERDHAVRAANRGRTLTPRAPFQPVKGAGGRFISHEERAAPQAAGPKALDPLAAEALAPLCAEAALASDQAIADAVARAAAEEDYKQEKRREHALDADNRTLEGLNKMLRQAAEMMDEAGTGDKAPYQQVLRVVAGEFEARAARKRK